MAGSTAKNSPAFTPTTPSDREIVMTRVFDAPREVVFEMWTDPKHLVHWWGPRGFTTTIQEMDVRPGGLWRKIMHGPDGANYPNHSVFLEVVKPERLVYKHGGHKEGGSSVVFETDGDVRRARRKNQNSRCASSIRRLRPAIE